jgi:hypothetical protein
MMKMPVSVSCDLCSWKFYADADRIKTKALTKLFREEWIQHQRLVHPAVAEERITRVNDRDFP